MLFDRLLIRAGVEFGLPILSPKLLEYMLGYEGSDTILDVNERLSIGRMTSKSLVNFTVGIGVLKLSLIHI